MKREYFTKKSKVAVAGLLAATLLIPSAAFADSEPATGDAIDQDLLDFIEQQNNPAFIGFTGKVKEITEREDGSKSVLSENAEGGLMNFIVTENTVMVTENELKEGAEVSGFYSAGPMILIYPPQAQAVTLAVDLPEMQAVKVDHFDKDLLSQGKDLVLNIGDDTEILLADGTTKGTKEDLADRDLIVLYSIVLESYPAQTTPNKVIVLPEAAVPPVLGVDEPTPIVDNMPIVVEGKQIDGSAYNNEDGTVMVPLRAISEALGYEVGWDSGKISLGPASMLEIGKDYYYFMRMAPVELGAAPELKDGVTYVPLSFFDSVLPYSGYVFEGQIEVTSRNDMQ